MKESEQEFFSGLQCFLVFSNQTEPGILELILKIGNSTRALVGAHYLASFASIERELLVLHCTSTEAGKRPCTES